MLQTRRPETRRRWDRQGAVEGEGHNAVVDLAEEEAETACDAKQPQEDVAYTF
jgi:hypothetical protein